MGGIIAVIFHGLTIMEMENNHLVSVLEMARN